MHRQREIHRGQGPVKVSASSKRVTTTMYLRLVTLAWTAVSCALNYVRASKDVLTGIVSIGVCSSCTRHDSLRFCSWRDAAKDWFESLPYALLPRAMGNSVNPKLQRRALGTLSFPCLLLRNARFEADFGHLRLSLVVQEQCPLAWI